jgi:hypothetical protein
VNDVEYLRVRRPPSRPCAPAEPAGMLRWTAAEIGKCPAGRKRSVYGPTVCQLPGMFGVSRGCGESAASGTEKRTWMAAEGEISSAPRVGHTATT